MEQTWREEVGSLRHSPAPDAYYTGDTSGSGFVVSPRASRADPATEQTGSKRPVPDTRQTLVKLFLETENLPPVTITSDVPYTVRCDKAGHYRDESYHIRTQNESVSIMIWNTSMRDVYPVLRRP